MLKLAYRYNLYIGFMLEKVYLAKQQILNRSNKIFGHELLFRDTQYGIKDFPSHITATSHVLINILTNIDYLLEDTGILFVNVDEEFLLSGLINILDKSKFLLEILETTKLTDEVISKIKHYHNKGYKIAIDDFDCSLSMIKKFSPIFKYVNLIKIDVLEVRDENLEVVVPKLKKYGLKLLAEKVETEEDYLYFLEMGFDMFQGYYFHKPETIHIDRSKDVTKPIVLDLIRLIKTDSNTSTIESYVKMRPDLSFKLVKFLNNHNNFDTAIESVVQVITLLGREKLLRWLLLYLYSEMSHNPVSEILLTIATKRATFMEDSAIETEKDKAYMAGMFSMLGPLFDISSEDAIKGINLDKDISDLIIEKKGKFSSSLRKSEQAEQTYLKKLFIDNFEKIDPIDIIYTLGFNGIKIDENKF